MHPPVCVLSMCMYTVMCFDRSVHDQQLAAAPHHHCVPLPVRYCAVPVPSLACTRLVVAAVFIVLTMLLQLGCSRALGAPEILQARKRFPSRSSGFDTRRANHTLPRREVAVMRSEGQHASAVLHRTESPSSPWSCHAEIPFHSKDLRLGLRTRYSHASSNPMRNSQSLAGTWASQLLSVPGPRGPT